MQPVGIDLGTGNSVIAIYRRGRADVLNVEGESIMPSVVAARPGGGLLVGRMAKRRALIDPENTVVAIKRQMGNREYRVKLDGRDYSPVDVSGMILRKLVESASEQLGSEVKDAVISVPAYFTNNQKEDTREAGKAAGLNVLRLIPEPTAAAVAYGLNKERDQTILVFDLGAGTFDVSILQVTGHNFEVKGIGGDHNLGGEDFDARMIDLILQKLRQDESISGALGQVDPERLHRQLKESAENAKKELSTADTADIEIPDVIPGQPIWFTVTRADFETAIRSLADRTIERTMDTLKRAGMTRDDVDRVVLVGGSTRIPLIQQSISEKIREPFIADHVDQLVAHGAAIVAATTTSVAEHVDLAPIEIRNITAHSLGVRAAEDKFVVLIPCGTPLPASAKKTFTTARDNADSTDVEVFQGEEPCCTNNEQLGGFQMVGLPRAKAGVPKIEVAFTLDEDDILTVNASDLSSGKSGELKIEKFAPRPYEPSKSTGVDINSVRIGCSPNGCDDAGAILRRLGLKFKNLANQDFRNQKIVTQYDVLFINCMCDFTQLYGPGSNCNPQKNRKALCEFVEGGGVLYVSDYAFHNIVDIFPGKIRFTGRKGPGGKHKIRIIDQEVRELTGETKSVDFGPAYVVVKDVSNECTVYAMRGASEPVLVSFPYGAGHVVYTSFHNGAGISNEVAEVIRFIILRTMSLATSTPLVELVESTHFRRS